MSSPSPCTLCPKEETCNLGHGCTGWKEWIKQEWDGFNRYAVYQGLTIERIDENGNKL